METKDERIDRIDALLQIGQLVHKYAFAIDSRDLEALAALYVEDTTREDLPAPGREALTSFVADKMRGFYRTMHQICGHAIEIVDPDHATGRVYTRAEHEQGDQWIVMTVCYFDEYERQRGRWYFARRTLHHLYVHRIGEGPRAPYRPPPWAPTRVPIPAAWGPSWSSFYANFPPGQMASLTRDPGT